MNKGLKIFNSFFALNGKTRKDVLLIIITYLQVSWLIRCYPLRKYYHRYFQNENVNPFDLAPYKNEINLIQKVLKNMPGKQACLKESIIVHLSLKRKGVNIPLFLGVSTENEFLAHAWYDENSSKGYSRLKGS